MNSSNFYRMVSVRRYYVLDGVQIPVERAELLLRQKSCYKVDRIAFTDHVTGSDLRSRDIPCERIILRSYPY